MANGYEKLSKKQLIVVGRDNVLAYKITGNEPGRSTILIITGNSNGNGLSLSGVGERGKVEFYRLIDIYDSGSLIDTHPNGWYVKKHGPWLEYVVKLKDYEFVG